MRPAFSSRSQAAAFVIVIAATLVMPLLMARTGWLRRADVYPSMAWKYGPFPYIQQKIFGETGDVDVAILGASHIWCSINTPVVKEEFTRRLGREANVFSLGWPWPGFDSLYVIARDLLEHRRVKVLVVTDEGIAPDLPHVKSSSWFRIGENSDVMRGLPLGMRARLYGQAVLGMPRHLLSLVRPNLLEDPARCRPNFWNSYYRAPNLAQNDGALRARLSWGSIYAVFTPYVPHGTATAADAVVYSPQTRDAFEFSGPATSPYQRHFIRLLAMLCAERGTRLVMLHTPTYHERASAKIAEREDWTKVLDAPVDVVGFPPNKLFGGVPPDDVQKLFFEDIHLNQNGQALFSPLIGPVLYELYAKSTTHP